MSTAFNLRWQSIPFRSVDLSDISLGSVIDGVLGPENASFYETYRNALYYRMSFTETTNLRLNMARCTFPFILRVFESSTLSMIAPVIFNETVDIRETDLPILYEKLVGPTTHIIEVKSLYPKDCGIFSLETY